MNHSSLKTEIKIAQVTTRLRRADANKILRQGRNLRKKAQSEKDAAKTARMMAAGWSCHRTSIHLRSEANAGRPARRHMHLAAAMLNGKTYQQCEPKCDIKPSAAYLGQWIQPHLPPEEQKHAVFLAEAWLKETTARLTYLREQGLVRLLDLDKKQVEIDALKQEIKKADVAHQHARSQAAQSERWFKEHTATATQRAGALKNLWERCNALESDLQREKDSIASTKAVTLTIDDLFQESA